MEQRACGETAFWLCFMQVCNFSGWLVVAHEKGEVRVYQFSPHAQDVTCLHIDNSSKCDPALPADFIDM